MDDGFFTREAVGEIFFPASIKEDAKLMLNIYVWTKSYMPKVFGNTCPQFLLVHDLQAVFHIIKPGSILPRGGDPNTSKGNYAFKGRFSNMVYQS
jgi:hypothetical protein